MKKIIVSLCAASLTSACATPSYYTPVQVTRFTSAPGDSLPRGAVTVTAAPGADSADLQLVPYERAVAEQLGMHGFSVSTGAAPYTAFVRVDRSVLRAGERGGPVSVGGGASTGSYGSGLGLGPRHQFVAQRSGSGRYAAFRQHPPVERRRCHLGRPRQLRRQRQ